MFRLITLLIATAALCSATPTASPISNPPNPGYPVCSICGDGNVVMNPLQVLKFPDQPELSCQAFEEAGKSGYIDSTICDGLVGIVSEACGCQVESAPTPAPFSAATTTTATTTTIAAVAAAGLWLGAQLLV